MFDEFSSRLQLGSSLRFAVHGFGSVGRGLSSSLVDRGHVLVAASDSGGGIHDADGLDFDELTRRKVEEGSVGDGSLDSAEVLTVDCDVIIPAALQGVIDADMADRVKAGLVLEGANGP